MAPIVRLHSGFPTLKGYSYFWAKKVTSFDPGVHCARCLRGAYRTEIGLKMPVGVDLPIPDLKSGDILYVCGVATPSKWDWNAHLAVRIDTSIATPVELPLLRGQRFTITGARRLPFDDTKARKLYPARSPAFLTCRNFQFGAHHFA